MEDEPFGYPLTGEELREIIARPSSERLDYYLGKSRETGQVWTIGAEEELIVLATEDEQPFVVTFPHPEFAQDWIEITDLDEIDLVAVKTEDWAREVLPGLQEAEIRVLVFPTSQSDGSLLDAEALRPLLVVS